MKIFGLDFTSAPTSARSRARRRKQLMLAEARLDAKILSLDGFKVLNGPGAGDFAEFERWLRTPGPWVAGLDFPFAQPVALVREIGWPAQSWSHCVSHVRGLDPAGFEAAIKSFRGGQPPGQKHRHRPVDEWAGSISPMMLHGVPVGKMFFRGAPQLLDAPVSIPILRPIADESRTVVEAYPSLVARRWLGGRPYKKDDLVVDDVGRRSARSDLVRAIRGDSASRHPKIGAVYGLTVEMTDDEADACIADATGDRLDSILCAIQAAWAHARRDDHFGMPADADPLEGWIADPGPSPAVADAATLGPSRPAVADEDPGDRPSPTPGRK